MNNIMEGVLTIAVGVIGLATLAVLVSKQSDTSNLIKSAGDSFGGILGVAMSPVTGSGGSTNFLNR